ncbi:MAG: hypothetical protein AB7G75_25410 [Candidatus Binatia bacterium]
MRTLGGLGTLDGPFEVVTRIQMERLPQFLWVMMRGEFWEKMSNVSGVARIGSGAVNVDELSFAKETDSAKQRWSSSSHVSEARARKSSLHSWRGRYSCNAPPRRRAVRRTDRLDGELASHSGVIFRQPAPGAIDSPLRQ